MNRPIFNFTFALAALLLFSLPAAPPAYAQAKKPPPPPVCTCERTSDIVAFAHYPEVFIATARKQVSEIAGRDIDTMTLTVTDVYKGSARGLLLPLYNNGTCTFLFEDGKRYLVFGTLEGTMHLQVSSCSQTREVPPEFTLDPASVFPPEMFQGDALPIHPSSTACRKDADCAVIDTHCGGCGCGAAVNAQTASYYAFAYRARCQKFDGARCNMHCPAHPACVKNACAMVKD